LTDQEPISYDLFKRGFRLTGAPFHQGLILYHGHEITLFVRIKARFENTSFAQSGLSLFTYLSISAKL
jgi:hypothetical protein